MGTQITKKQFIVITALVIIITLVVVITVVKNKKTVNENVEISPSVQTSTVSKQTTVSNEVKTTISEQSSQEIKEEEEISTTIQGNTLPVISKNIESKNIFGEMFEPNPEEIDDYMNIDVSLFDEYIIKMSTSKFKSELYMIFKPVSGNEEKAMAQIKNFLINYENSWSSLDYKQYDIVSNRKAIKRNGYLIYIVSNNNEDVMNIIRENI